MKKEIIGLIWLKGTWKDFIANNILSDYYSFAIADEVKIESAKNLLYLEKDDELINNTPSLIKQLEVELKKQEVHMPFNEEHIKNYLFVGSKTKELSDINLLKNQCL